MSATMHSPSFFWNFDIFADDSPRALDLVGFVSIKHLEPLDICETQTAAFERTVPGSDF